MPPEASRITEKEKRSAYFDNLRAILIILVLIGHFGGDNTSFGVGGNVFLKTIECFIYLFHMPLLFFISGVFSKDTEKCREKAVFDLLVPYLLFQVFYGIVQYLLKAETVYLHNPFWPAPALWYLLALFFYRFLLRDLIKIRWNLVLAALLSVFSFLLIGLSHDFAMNRAIPYLFYFLLGYHIKASQIVSLRAKLLRKKMGVAAALLLMGLCCAVFAAIYHLLSVELLPFSDFLGLIGHSKSCVDVGIGRSGGFLFTIALSIATFITSAALLLLTPQKYCFLSNIGSDTLPLYLSHMLIQLLYYQVQRRYFFFESWTVNYLLSFLPVALCVAAFSSKGYRKLFHKCLGWFQKIIRKAEVSK